MISMKKAASELSDLFGFNPPIPLDMEEEDLKSELLEAATQLEELDTITATCMATLEAIGAIIPEGISVSEDPPKGGPVEKPKPTPKKKPKTKKEKPVPKKEAKKTLVKKEEPKAESTPPPPVKARAGRANTIKRRELTERLIREGKWQYKQIIMKVSSAFPEYSPLAVITDLANSQNPNYCFFEYVAARNPDGVMYFTKEKPNGKFYFGTKAKPRGPAKKAKIEEKVPAKKIAKPKKEDEPKKKVPAKAKKKEAPKKVAKPKAPAKKKAEPKKKAPAKAKAAPKKKTPVKKAAPKAKKKK